MIEARVVGVGSIVAFNSWLSSYRRIGRIVGSVRPTRADTVLQLQTGPRWRVLVHNRKGGSWCGVIAYDRMGPVDDEERAEVCRLEYLYGPDADRVARLSRWR